MMANQRWLCHTTNFSGGRFCKAGDIVLSPTNPDTTFFVAFAGDVETPCGLGTIDMDGTWRPGFIGWDDLSFSAVGINPPGAASDPTVESDLTKFPGSLLFAGNVENILAGTFQFPHRRAHGKTLFPHIHWNLPVGAAASGVDWRFYARFSAPGKVATAWSSAIAGTVEIDGGISADAEHITSFGGLVVPTEYDVPSVNVSWKLHRLGNTDGNSGTARLLFVDFHFATDAPLGSGQEYQK